MKKNIAVIMGGYSGEAKISLKSGAVVQEYLDKSLFTPYPIHIRKGSWVYEADDGTEFPINRSDFSLTLNNQHIGFDAVFNAIHGTPGEDGLLQAYFELLGIPHTSCDFYQAALTFNKRDLLKVVAAYGIKSARSYHMNAGDPVKEDEIIAAVSLPCFVKANKAGSSLGISKVHEKAKLGEAIAHALQADDEVLIEEALDGTEVSVGVITYQGKTKVLPITEITTDRDFFDYEAKYDNQSKEITPARINKAQEKNVVDAARRIYEVLKLKGFIRSEFIFQGNIPYLLEVNTTPGLTTESILPQQAQKAGIGLRELFTNALEEIL